MTSIRLRIPSQVLRLAIGLKHAYLSDVAARTAAKTVSKGESPLIHIPLELAPTISALIAAYRAGELGVFPFEEREPALSFDGSLASPNPGSDCLCCIMPTLSTPEEI
jgi:hypothetical protein